MPGIDATGRAGLPTVDDADHLYNTLLVAIDVVEEIVLGVRRTARSSDGSDLAFIVDMADIGAVAAIAADVRMRGETLTEGAAELERAIFDLDGIRRAQRDAA